MILSAQSIMRRQPILDPQPRTELAVPGLNNRTFTHGLSPAGYDLRLSHLDDDFGREMDSGCLAPGQFILASAVEEFDMPDDLLGVVHDKSTWARLGLAVQNTVIEPGWKGFLTLELTNHSDQAIILPYRVGICQVIFHQLDEPTEQPYSGKYQNQAAGPQEAR